MTWSSDSFAWLTQRDSHRAAQAEIRLTGVFRVGAATPERAHKRTASYGIRPVKAARNSRPKPQEGAGFFRARFPRGGVTSTKAALQAAFGGGRSGGVGLSGRRLPQHMNALACVHGGSVGAKLSVQPVDVHADRIVGAPALNQGVSWRVGGTVFPSGEAKSISGTASDFMGNPIRATPQSGGRFPRSGVSSSTSAAPRTRSNS